MASSLAAAEAESKFHVVVHVKEESICNGENRERKEADLVEQQHSNSNKCSIDGPATEIEGELSDKERRSSTSSSVLEPSADPESELKVHLEKAETRVCRICHLSMDFTDQKSGFCMVLGCSCKDDLAAAHKQCAEAWFEIKGNKTCEVCGSTACNVVGVNEAKQYQESGFTVPAGHQYQEPSLAAQQYQAAAVVGTRKFVLDLLCNLIILLVCVALVVLLIFWVRVKLKELSCVESNSRNKGNVVDLDPSKYCIRD